MGEGQLSSAGGGMPLGQSDTQFRLLVDGVADYAIYMISPEGLVASWNSGAQRIKGYAPAEIIGHHYREFYTEQDQASHEPENNLRRAANEGRAEAEGWRVRKDGTRFWAHVIIDRILDDEGHLLGFAKVTRDVTEQRLAAQQLEEAREALFQSQKMEAIGQLTGGMAHDFNNLLMAIQSALDLLGRHVPADEHVQNLIGVAQAGVNRGKNLSQRMLAFARKQELQPRAVDVVELVHGMSELIDSTLGARFKLATRFAYRLDRVMVDPHQLELALLNLVVNARDAYGDEGGRISIEADMSEAPHGDVPGLAEGSYLRLAVIDQGPGMDERTLSRAADPFFTTKGVGKGTGLGLSMVHGLAAQSRGRLVLRSQVSVGTRADIWLPVVTASDARMAAAAAPPTAMAATKAAETLRILAVDDDVLVLSTLKALLEDMGHVVTAASSGERAIELLRGEERFDLLLTDYAMPHLTGGDVALAALTTRPGLPIVLATGYADMANEAFPGMQRLGKPFDRDNLARAIARAMA
ncbi:PAS domain-containing sensor histidine kinase [Luteibacter aegosomatissinici]|uniref:PAS domain-containing sensor histidine kinase n=1 Tax=Luteibacter aegosomatissinici TaxID=2911539 RepID=UPI001FF990B1|nr:PAS domain-containing sensor histidine kinase [Luteibacter aegosomatissinici]UPG94347.1 PAS domain S-box protein [Luteibacter aegosomatissinici]